MTLTIVGVNECYNIGMNCPVCKTSMKKIGWRITNNSKNGDEYKEYDKTTYHCASDDAWVEVELPAPKQE